MDGPRLSFEFPQLWPVAVLLVVLALGLSLRVYRLPEGGGRLMRWLPVLRCAAVLLLAVSVLGPVWRRPLTEAEAGEIAVVVDTSRSMSIVDTQRTPDDRLRLAIALGRFDDPDREQEDRRRGALEEIRTEVETVVAARAAVEFAEVTRADPTEPRRRWAIARDSLADTIRASRSVFPPSAENGLNALTTGADAGTSGWLVQARQRIGSVAAAVEADYRQRLSRRVVEDPEASRAAASVSHLSRLGLAQALLSPEARLLPTGVPVRVFDSRGSSPGMEADDVGTLVAEGDTSDLTRVLTRVSSPEGERRLRGIVVLSDGRNTTPGPLDGIAPGVRVHTVALAPAAPPPGVRVMSLDVPDNLVTGQTATVRVVLGSSGTDPSPNAGTPGRGGSTSSAPAEVSLVLPGQTQTRTVDLRSAGPVTLDFDLVADRSGDLPLEIVVQPRPGDAPGTAVRLARTVRVTGERVRVLLVSGSVGWDVQHLGEVLASTPWVRLTVARPVDDLAGLVSRADAVVTAGVPAAQVDDAARRQLRDLVDRRAGVLVFLPGSAGVPDSWSADSELSRYLPGTSPEWLRSPGAEGSFRALPLNSTAAHGAGRVGTEADWSTRRGFWRLLRFAELSAATATLIVDRSSALPVVTEKRVGLGRSVTLHTDQLWRTDLGSGVAVGGSEASEAVRPLPGSPWWLLLGLVAERPYAASFGGISMDAGVRALPGSDSSGGQSEVQVRLRSVDSKGSPGLAPPPRLVLRSSGRTVLSASASASGPGQFTATFAPVPAGQYTLQLEGQEEPRMRLQVGDGGEAELADVSGDRESLERLSRTTGGIAVAAENAAELATALSLPPVATGAEGTHAGPAIRSLRLWNSPGLLLLVLSFLVAEWALRKHWGLA